jgi:hypothetical protein
MPLALIHRATASPSPDFLSIEQDDATCELSSCASSGSGAAKSSRTPTPATYSIFWNGRLAFWDIEPGSAAESANYAGDENLRLDLICGHDFYLRLSLVKLDCAGNADDFPLERGDMRVGRNF